MVVAQIGWSEGVQEMVRPYFGWSEGVETMVGPFFVCSVFLWQVVCCCVIKLNAGQGPGQLLRPHKLYLLLLYGTLGIRGGCLRSSIQHKNKP